MNDRREVVEENKLWLIFGSSICGFEGMYRFYRFSLGRDVQVFLCIKLFFLLSMWVNYAILI